ncbi:hypothetical protein M422DRAFT_48187 [Sphaerobolus stellatus SS14]|uniref:Uncharacterized protein n=1 Tax=Sphaerobolus stellatus (strain SS14) TaxID=990650 RepID=A0A0C9V6G6_SPHS4|nr:hypothetical protein M422DRAFT_48187 [Sphaerobolus stellatus SS14]
MLIYRIGLTLTLPLYSHPMLRVLVKIDNLLARTHTPEQAPNLIEQLFHVAKRPTASLLWAHESEDYHAKEKAALLMEGWTPEMQRCEAFPLQIKVRARIFRELPDEEQHEWREKAKRYKPKVPSSERYKPIIDGKQLDFCAFPAAEAYDIRFQETAASGLAVLLSELLPLPIWKPTVSQPPPKVVGLTLAEFVELDEQGQVMTEEAELREILQTYTEQTYGTIPIAILLSLHVLTVNVALVHLGRSRKSKAPKPAWEKIAASEGQKLREPIKRKKNEEEDSEDDEEEQMKPKQKKSKKSKTGGDPIEAEEGKKTKKRKKADDTPKDAKSNKREKKEKVIVDKATQGVKEGVAVTEA